MAKINVLGFEIANLIAAGEVVDRPASVVKELLENSIDAGATAVTAEIRHGGTSFIRISDNGCGMEAEDMPLSVLRHATSKIARAEDLSSIGTLGFRGEALAAIAAVCRLQMYSRTAASAMGTVMECEGGEIINIMETGCAAGTTVTARELFYNVPARRKFLKKDATETAAVSAAVEKLALSSPGVSVKYIVDGEVRFMTAGDGDLRGCVYSVFGRDTASRMLAVDRTDDNSIRVSGFVSEPDMVRSNRNSENFFINGRYVKSKTAVASLEQAFATRIPHDKFPFAVLNIGLNPETVDVNVHPSKLEVKFANERIIFEAVYYAVLSALEGSGKRPEMKISEPLPSPPPPPQQQDFFVSGEKARQTLAAFVPVEDNAAARPKKAQIGIPRRPEPQAEKAAPEIKEEPADTPPDYRIIGEAYNCYVLVELEDRLLVIDKHAAHERILFDEMCRNMKARKKRTQILMFPLELQLDEGGFEAIADYDARIKEVGFAYRADRTKLTLSVSEIPSELNRDSAEAMLRELSDCLGAGAGTVEAAESKYFEARLYQASCKAAIKGGRLYAEENLRFICDRLLQKPAEGGAVIKTCPHGRPVAFEIKKSSVERQFNRLT